MILNYYNDPTTLIISAIIMVMALIFHNMVQTWVAGRRRGRTTRGRRGTAARGSGTAGSRRRTAARGGRG